MAEKVFLQYWIYIDDKDEAARLGAVIEPGSNQAAGAIIRAPEGAAVEFNAPIVPKGQPFTPGVRCITSDYFGTEANYPTNVAKFTRKIGGWFGISWLFGKTVEFYWRGIFAYNAPLDAGLPPGEAKIEMARRRWFDGFEAISGGEGSMGSTGYQGYCLAASRHVGSYGMRISNSTFKQEHDSWEPVRSGPYKNDGWERFYVRVLRLPDTQARLWYFTGLPNTAQGMRMDITPDGHFALGGTDSAGTFLVKATPGYTIPLDVWLKVDVVYKGGADGFCHWFINGAPLATILAGSFSSGQGVAGLTSVVRSRIGDALAGHHGTWDVDDWVGCDLPAGATATFSGAASLDWIHGSRMIAVPILGFAASNDGNYAGPGGADANDWRMLEQRHVELANAYTDQGLTTTALSARLALVMDTARVFALPNVLGMAAFQVVWMQSGPAGALLAQLGYKLPGGADVLTPVTSLVGKGWQTAVPIIYQPAAGSRWDPLQLDAGLEVIAIGDSNAGTKWTYQLFATMELIGDHRPEDHVKLQGDADDVKIGEPHFRAALHNAWYRESQWTKEGPPPLSPVVVKAGTYVGNGKHQQLAFRAPVNVLIVRRTDATNDSALFLSSDVGAHYNFTYQQVLGNLNAMIDPNFAPANEDDQSMQTLIRIVGRHSQMNANGITYQYLAICDPGMRFTQCGTVRETAYGAVTDELLCPWTPAVVWWIKNFMQAVTNGFYESGPGLAAPAAMERGAASEASFATVGVDGAISFPANTELWQSSGTSEPPHYVAFRTDDGSGDDGARRFCNVLSYTGDGTASRTISFAPASGRRPMWALVIGSNGNAAFRDPAHTATNSLQLPASNSTTDITGGGVDSISVGVHLNTNGVVFDVIVFWAADATAGNGGWGTSGENIPVEPGNPGGGPNGPWGPEPATPGEPPVIPEPQPEPGTEESYDFADDCVDGSVKVINIALSRIGISKQVGDILTESSAEATAARLHYSTDVTEVLRDFPWPFATRYADLELVAGDATYQDTVQDWFSTVTYEVGEAVLRAGLVYYCTVRHTNHDPALLASAGYWSEDPVLERVNKDWLFAFRVPDRFVFARRIVNPNLVGRAFDPNPPKWRLGADERGQLIYTNEINPQLEYTYRPTCAAESGDALFRSALAWRHAMSLCAPLARDEKKIAFATAMYEGVLGKAKRWAASEQQHDPDGDAEWITARN